MDEHLKELHAYYCGKYGHKLSPGIHVAYIGNDEFYASVQAFPSGINSRHVVSKAREPSAESAVEKAMQVWRLIIADLEAKVDATAKA